LTKRIWSCIIAARIVGHPSRRRPAPPSDERPAECGAVSPLRNEQTDRKGGALEQSPQPTPLPGLGQAIGVFDSPSHVAISCKSRTSESPQGSVLLLAQKQLTGCTWCPFFCVFGDPTERSREPRGSSQGPVANSTVRPTPGRPLTLPSPPGGEGKQRYPPVAGLTVGLRTGNWKPGAGNWQPATNH
jgi:hypothetical protein